MAKAEKWYKKRYFDEIIFFCAIFILTMLPNFIKPVSLMDLFKNLVFFMLLYSQAILHRYFIFPFLMARAYGRYFVSGILFIFLSAGVLLAVDYYWVDPEYYKMEDVILFRDFLYEVVLCSISTAAFLSLFLVRNYSKELEKKNKAQLMLSEMNIKYLHAQLNPHFFFNMLNNLYGVSLTEPSRTPELILKLSDLMRYQLENTNKDIVNLEEELSFIRNYIAMEKERVGKRCVIEYNIEDKEMNAHNYQIAPLILITLVENAFKHSLTTEREWFVKIVVHLENGVLRMSVHNSMPDQSLKTSSTGIGLLNIRERLELLYSGHYMLDIVEESKEYQTNLVLSLKYYNHE
ncbi:histidine kinase [Elizabethkingia ursingii]|uniref:Histidine kinase n=2 Tax=Elizabethkingia ursingii TaxID=1756150 RepID=A0ABX3N8S4_9FLAO|nr:histidine kinase [Elizabethkingia ursingii]OPB88835.1 histidine kinase [Elizabethkingia ursingii]OPC04792.1 histidine kinase [Elizabethkingia ursingii]